MKINTLSIVLYFSACFATIFFNTVGQEDYMLWSKVFIVPSIALYYLSITSYKVDFVKAGIFGFSFIGDIYRLISPNNFETGQIICFLASYILLLYYIFPSFIQINLKHKYNILLIALIVFLLTTLAYFILSLKFEKMQINMSFLIFFSIILETLLCIAIVEYSRKATNVTVSLLMLVIFFVFSDCFYIINKFYLAFSVFDFIQIFTQVFTYYFLVNFFISHEKEMVKLD